MSDDDAISYLAVPSGVPVLTATGHEIGTLEHVLQIPEEDLFDGLVVATKDGLRFVDADQVQVITRTYVRSTLDDAAAAGLPAPAGERWNSSRSASFPSRASTKPRSSRSRPRPG